MGAGGTPGDERLPLGKLSTGALGFLLDRFGPVATRDAGSRVVCGARVGSDVAVLDMGDRYLVSKVDPITFATEEIGYYAVHINANDVATSGAIPRWFSSTILMPPSTTGAAAERIFADVAAACQSLGVEVIGGHTEVTHSISHPIVVGAMLGEVTKEKLVTSSGGQPGDALVVTKGIVLEGTAICALERRAELLVRGFTDAQVAAATRLLHDPGLSIVPECRIACDHFPVHAIHDPTEGGLANGIAELCSSSGVGCLIDERKIPEIPGSREICAAFGLRPLGTITSGTGLIALPADQGNALVGSLANHGIPAAVVGQLTPAHEGLRLVTRDGSSVPLAYSDTDEITKIF
jgi:hydrogenase maturation factor